MVANSSQFLIRPRPFEDESLSSWRQRVGWENGYFLFPVPDERTRRADPDTGVRDLDWVASVHGASPTAVRDMTLRRFVGTVVSHLESRSQPQWWLRSRYGATDRPYGPMFCPSCLASDRVPFFRLSWRLGFVTVCPVHQVLLVDQCRVCGKPPWPSGCGIRGRVHRCFTSLRNCWHCGTDMSAFPTSKTHGWSEPEQWVATGDARFGDKSVNCYEALCALRAICQLFLRNRSRGVIAKSRSRWMQTARDMSAVGRATQVVEHLPVGDRHRLFGLALEILSGWPESFIEFGREAGISRMHFNGADHLQPQWMSEVVDMEFAKQNRWVTGAALETAIAELKSCLGRMPSKKEVRNHLDWQGDRGLEVFYPVRSTTKD